MTERPDVPSEILVPRDAWADKAAYDATARKLTGLLKENFKKYETGASAEVKAAGPVSCLPSGRWERASLFLRCCCECAAATDVEAKELKRRRGGGKTRRRSVPPVALLFGTPTVAGQPAYHHASIWTP